MTEYPTLDDLFWLFEVEPVLSDPDLGLRWSMAVWSTTRGPWTVVAKLIVHDRFLEIEGHLNGVSTFHIKLDGIVERLWIDRTGGQEALVAAASDANDTYPMRLTLKPHVRFHIETAPLWQPG